MYMPGRGCPCDQPPVKTLGIKSPVGVPSRQHFTRVVITHCWGSARPERTLGVGAWSPVIVGGHLFPLQILLGSSVFNKSNPQGHFSGTTPQRQRDENPNSGRHKQRGTAQKARPSWKKRREGGHADLGKHRNQASSGRWEQGFCIYLLSTPTFFLPLLVCSKFKFPKSN